MLEELSQPMNRGAGRFPIGRVAVACAIALLVSGVVLRDEIVMTRQIIDGQLRFNREDTPELFLVPSGASDLPKHECAWGGASLREIASEFALINVPPQLVESVTRVSDQAFVRLSNGGHIGVMAGVDYYADPSDDEERQYQEWLVEHFDGSERVMMAKLLSLTPDDLSFRHGWTEARDIFIGLTRKHGYVSSDMSEIRDFDLGNGYRGFEMSGIAGSGHYNSFLVFDNEERSATVAVVNRSRTETRCILEHLQILKGEGL